MSDNNLKTPLKTLVLACLAAIATNVQAEHGNIELEQLEVTAQHIAPATLGIEAEKREIQQTPGAVSFIDMESVTEGQVSSLEDAFRYVPGVWAPSTSGNDSVFFTSRGSNLDAAGYDMNGIKLLQDGLPVTAADGNNHNHIIDPLSAQYAVFAHGANAMKYGASTLGGAVNFITRTAHNTSPLSLSLSGGSHGERLTRLTASQVFNGYGDGLVTIENKEWDGYRDHNKQTRSSIYANGGIRLSDTVSTRFYVTHRHDDQELPSSLSRAEVRDDPEQANASAKRGAGHFQKDVDIKRVANKTTWDIDENRRFEFGVSFEEQELHHPIVYSPFFSLLIDNTVRNAGTMARYQHKVGNHDWLMGFNYGETRVDGGNYSHFSGDKTEQSSKTENYADTLELFLMDRWQFADDWTLIAGAQAVKAEREVKSTNLATSAVTEADDDYNSINPRLGLIYQLSADTSVYSSLSRLFEAPTTYQLDDGTDTLDAMDGEVFELGTRGHKALGVNSHWGWDVSAYYAKLDNEILSVEDPAMPGQFITSNADDTIHAGIDALLTADIALTDDSAHRLTPMVSLSWNRFRFDDDDALNDNTLPGAPKFVMKGEMLYRHKNGFYFGPTVDYVSERYADFVNSYKVDSYTLFGLKSGWSNKNFRVFGEVRNLFERDYIASHSVRAVAAETDAILSPGAPLSAYVGIEYKL
ncbi:TonB-dependent receptor [Methylophaga thiooxydans]|uniref:TonB-dependent receptor n=1 Tax=Methylophaga thiooxydans TaxID=392484 RepID=A0A0A0BK56_9GAMM|nr:TonB-dependent receptor [Methylophaga thiooxydans]KGM07489.1 TonB-dependent receptor [Methylophaga thiooxydans]